MITILYSKTLYKIIVCIIIIITIINLSLKTDIENKPKSLDYIEKIISDETIKYQTVKSLKNRIVRERYNVDCQSIFLRNDIKVIQQAKLLSDEVKNLTSELDRKKDENFIFDKSTCEDYKLVRDYNRFDKYNEEIEKNFPIAYAILIYYSAEQIDRLLRLIWRPQNVYCFHIDSKSSDTFKKAIQSIVNCFNNVFIAQKSERIIWGHFSILKAELNCMDDLIKTNVTWKYLIHMAGDEFPLKTNYELVKILSVYNGVNDIDINYGSQYSNRIEYSYILKGNSLLWTNKTKNKPPHGYKIMKGNTFSVLSRELVKHILNDQKVSDLIEWSKDMKIPDEM